LHLSDRCRANFRRGKLPRIDALDVLVHRSGVHKGVMVYHRDAVVYVLVDVRHVGDFIDRVVVVNVGDLNDADAGVGHIYVLNIARTCAIPRDENLSRP
jgi:nitrogen regulatory protein PII